MPELQKLPKKILIISSYAPPAISGGAQCLYRTLSNLTPDSYCFFTSHNNFKEGHSDQNYILPCRYYFFDEPHDKKTKRSRLLTILNKPFRLFAVFKQALQIIKKERIEVLVGITDQGRMFMMTYLLSKITGIPYCPWIIDLYADNNFPQPWKLMAHYFEPKLVRGATLVFTSCPGIEEHLRNKYPYGRFQTINISGFDDNPNVTELPVQRGPEITLLFSGNIYWAHESAIDEIVTACRKIKDFKIKMVFYAPNPSSTFLEKYSNNPDVEIRSAKRPELLLALSQADILLIPFSWQSESDVVIKTATPTKLIDYLVSGRPILIYAPKGSFLSKYGREKEFAAVVDEQNPEKIQSAIRKIITDREYALRLIENARKTFHENHDAYIVSKTFFNSLSNL